MVTIAPQLQEQPKGFLKGLGLGVSQSLPQGIQQLALHVQEAQKQKNMMDLLGGIYGKQQSSDFSHRVSGHAPAQSSASSMQNLPDEAIAAVSLKDPNLGRILQEQKKLGQKQFSEERKIALDETRDYRERLSEKARSAEELDPVLNQMEKLVKSGKLNNVVISKLADKFGMIGLLNPESQQFQALSVGFLSNAKDLFGSRVTNYDLQVFIDKIPRLAQTDAGKKVLIDNFRVLGEASKIRNQIKNQIIKENRGVPPLDLEEQVSERSAPKLNSLADKFNKNLFLSEESSPGKIYMRSPDGKLGEVPKNRIDEALSKGYRVE